LSDVRAAALEEGENVFEYLMVVKSVVCISVDKDFVETSIDK
jgi:hypothetical protein